MSTPERLIEATRELLWDRGYTGTSPRAIQRRAEAGQGSMYHHFTGKQELALAAIERTVQVMRANVEATLSGDGSAYDRIEAYLMREREVLRGCPVGRLTMDPDIMSDETLRTPVGAALQWLSGRLARTVEEGQRRGELPATLVPAEIAATIVATVQGGYVLARGSGSPVAFDVCVKGLLSILSPLFPQPAAA